MYRTLFDNDNVRAIQENVISLIENKEFPLALELLDTAIETQTDDLLLQLRATVHSIEFNWDKAIDDLNDAVRINPDDSERHLCLGIYRTLQLFGATPHRFGEHYPTLEQIQNHYADCLARDPACHTAWLNTAETYLFLKQWDLAIATYGDSRAYIADEAHKVTHGWIGCLALTLSGDPIFDEDRQALYNQSIRFAKGFHDTRQVEILLEELDDEGFDENKLDQAREIHDEFLSHFDETPDYSRV